MTKELKEARERLEDAIDCSGAAREDDEFVVVYRAMLLAICRLLGALSHTGGGDVSYGRRG
jgi:hypothetical protein